MDAHDDARHVPESHDCAGCPIAPPRRRFLRDALGAVAGAAIVSLAGARAAEALDAMPPRAARRLTSGGAGGDVHRYAIPATDGAEIDRDAQVILVRWQGSVYAFDLSCPHQNTALRWNQSVARFQCPKHRSQYQPSGEFITGRATRGMDRLGIERSGAGVAVDVEKLYEQDRDPAGWAAAVVKVA